jgi:hypothetical protein
VSRIRRVRYVVLALLCAMYFITYIEPVPLRDPAPATR